MRLYRNKFLFLAALGAATSAGGFAPTVNPMTDAPDLDDRPRVNPIAAAAAETATQAGAGTPAPNDTYADVMDPPNDAEMEKLIQAKGLTAPRLTPELVQSVIVDETYTRLEGTNTTVCRLQLANGFCVVGVNNGPVSAANFDQEIGCQYAYKGAVDQVWTLEGYLLRQRLHELEQAPEGSTHVAKPVFVTARKIVSVGGAVVGRDECHLILDGGGTFVAGPEMTARYWPLAGDYLVTQSDGYSYINPADVFERKYAALHA